MQQQPIEHLGFRLAPLTRADESLFIALFSCAEVMQQIGPVLTEADALALLEKVLAAGRQGYLYWVVWNPQGQQVGLAALTLVPPASAEFGLMLFPEFFFKGYSVPVLSGLINYGFNQLGLEAVVAKHQISTAAAPGLLKRLFIRYQFSRDGYMHWCLSRAQWQELTQQPPYATDR
ncbi:GNAT family N-acetyltransferase [Rheinheimera sp.]|uniref:GNAT family N-acetyltransferase n=1 Tax=Rheinheimera sp. TaxID=1869214 RepID=UPI00307DE427